MKKVLLLVLIISFIGCVMMEDFIDLDMTYSKFQSTGETFPPYQGEVKVLDKKPPQYTKVGIIRTTKEADSWEELIEEMKYVAAKKGANAIVIIDKKKIKREEGDKTKVGKVRVSSYRLYYEKYMVGIAVRTAQ